VNKAYICGIVVAAALLATGCQPDGFDTSAPGAEPAQRWTMPNLVGTNLQQAQDRIQTLTGRAIFFTSSHDATGRHRAQINDSNWKICSQSIAAGAPITKRTRIDFGTVKLAEKCP
jgi:hypothetical protein